MKSFTLEQENASLKEQLENELSSVNYKNQCNDMENDNLLLLQQKGFNYCLLIKINFYKLKYFYIYIL